jgi:hypothetical protein
MTTGAPPGRLGESFPRPLKGPRAARWSQATRHRACDVLRMDERNVRGQQQYGEATRKPEESPSFTVEDRLAATIPGVRARVQFLFRLRTPGAFDGHEVSSRTSPARSETRRLCLTRSTFAYRYRLATKVATAWEHST